ncbi:polyprenyl synthetase family protein [Amycolatopsis japonica]
MYEPPDATGQPSASTEVQYLVSESRRRIDQRIRAFIEAKESLLDQTETTRSLFDHIRNFIDDKGKRLRSALCYWAWRSVSKTEVETSALDLAASLEFFHSFAVVHDDIMDESDHRRGRPTLHRSLASLQDGIPAARRVSRGVNLAILAGDLYFSWFTSLFHSVPAPPRTRETLAKLVQQMCDETVAGQYLDLLWQAPESVDADRSLLVARMKTAGYTVSKPMQLGACLGGADPVLLNTFAEYGRLVGEAYQLRNDVDGLLGGPGRQSQVDDLRLGKPTVLAAVARAQIATSSTRFDSLFGNPGLDAGSAEELRELIRGTAAPAVVEGMIDTRLNLAARLLRNARMNPQAREAITYLTGHAFGSKAVQRSTATAAMS